MKKFEEDLNVAVFTTKFIFRDGLPILYVLHHDDDGAWEFVGDQHVMEEDYIIVSLEEMINHDPSILEIADLPLGAKAYRDNQDSAWRVKSKSVSDN